MTETNDLPVCQLCKRPPISFLSYEQTEIYYCPKHTGLLSESQWRKLMGGGEAVAWCFTDVDGKPAEFCDPPSCANEKDLRIRTPLYTTPQPPAVPGNGLLAACEKLRDDLLMRASRDDDGTRAVHVSHSIWCEFNDAMDAATPPQDQELKE